MTGRNDAWDCINCEQNVGKTPIRIEQSDFVNHGDHGERYVTYVALCCSWACVEAAAKEAQIPPGGKKEEQG